MEFSGTWRLASCFIIPLSRKHAQTTAFRTPRRFLIDMAWFEGALVLNRALFKFGRFVRLFDCRNLDNNATSPCERLPLPALTTPRPPIRCITRSPAPRFSPCFDSRATHVLFPLCHNICLCHLGSYSVDFEFECRSGRARRACVLRFLEAAFLCAGHVASRVFVL